MFGVGFDKKKKKKEQKHFKLLSPLFVSQSLRVINSAGMCMFALPRFVPIGGSQPIKCNVPFT